LAAKTVIAETLNAKLARKADFLLIERAISHSPFV
jgi:hypothetical protein